MANNQVTKETKLPRDRLLPKLTMAFFTRPRIAAALWIVLTIFGALSYTTFLKREGFPSVNIPIAIAGGTYFVNSPAKVDTDVAKPLSNIALSQTGVDSVQTHSSDNFFSVTIQYKEGTDANVAVKTLENDVKTSGKLPTSVQVQYNVPNFGATGPDIQKIDAAVSFYSKDSTTSVSDINAKAELAAKWLNQRHVSDVQSVFVKSPFKTVTDPSKGKAVTIQQTFDRFGTRINGQTYFHNSVLLGVTAVKGADVIKLDKNVRDATEQLQKQQQFQGYSGEVSASFAPSIKDNLSELQRVLLEGLLAILVVGSIVIAIRASIITVVSMITVLVTSIGFLYVIGYSLNVITLFALILGLALIVDDTIIMVEAIDAARRRHVDPRVAVKEAVTRISRAMVAATATASLCFAPLLFVGGVLGSFIRAIPITIIASLIISLFVALIFIPFFARFLLLSNKQMGKKNESDEIASGFEARLAAFIAAPMLWARNSKRKLFGVGITALVVGFGFTTAGLVIAKSVVFNIFPPSKDTNGLVLTMNFPQGTTIGQAGNIAAHADKMASDIVSDNFVQSSYYNTGNAQNAIEQIKIVSYNKRAITSPAIVKQLQSRFNSDFHEAKVAVAQVDLGPPSAAFTIQLDASNRQAAFKAAGDLSAYLSKTELKRISGKTAHFTNVTVSSPDQYIRTGDKPIVTITSGFDGNDTTTLVTLAQSAVNKDFNSDKLHTYGLPAGALSYNLGQETQNQNSFKTLALAFPILLIVIFILLAFEFRSLLQPLLIFMAIPFSIFGVMLGLYITDNPISFFAMLGFFALVGLSIKNTILLTDFANQSRRSGLSAIDSAHAALEERFRPLFATSMTAVVSLIPLAISSPFWQGLAVVLIFGLLSSTFLVITVFPYYYLGAEYLRLHIAAKDFFIWLVLTGIVAVVVGKLAGISYGLIAVVLSLLLVILQNYFHRRLAKA